MTSAQVRQSFLDFFKSKQHTIVNSSSLMPDSPNLLFTNAGMNQFVPIFLGQTKCPYTPGRAADTQKCIRAGGKHNDLEDVGLDTYHHTFFEMLGNWSFGDYFKAEAIDFAWELITEVWKFPKHRLYATVYAPDKSKGDPSDFDQEAWDKWAEKFRAAGLDPAVHIVNGNKKDNFWMMGETGPCGPCTELHVDLTPEGDTKGTLVNGSDARCMEIWNLVFIQFNANPDGTFSPLPARHVDTGMGFERVAGIMQCTKNFKDFSGVISNYESDVFTPLFRRLEELSGKKYGSTLPAIGATLLSEQEKADIAFRVIADHIRTLSFAIADGIQPGNSDRNYVLRRILRRAVRYGRTLGLRGGFFHKLVDVLAETMGDVFPEIRSRRTVVADVIRIEEESFNRTLDKGIALFEEAAAKLPAGGTISGALAFRLYDEQGFPLDLTQLMARERGLTVDGAGFEKLMEEQRARARAAQKKEVITLSDIGSEHPTTFTGYESLQTKAKVAQVAKIKERTAVILDKSPCYAEMGGQVGDAGIITQGGRQWRVVDTQKSGQTWLHFVEGEETPETGAEIEITVDQARRDAIQRHHTVTHVLHWALHEVVSKEASQKGSAVDPTKLTFDFNGQALTPGQLIDIERLVNERILANDAVSWSEVKYANVKGRPDIMQFFGDKYGESVRVVQVGGKAAALDGWSMELCAGTHVRHLGEIGLFRISGENAIAAGVRRIEAVAGLAAYERARAEAELLKALSTSSSTPIPDLIKRFEALIEQGAALEKKLKSYRDKESAILADSLAAKAADRAGFKYVIAQVSVENPNDLRELGAKVAGKVGPTAVVVLAAVFGDKVSLVANCGPDAVKAGKAAGKIVTDACGKLGGKGGGKPDAAMGGGTDISKVAEALGSVV
ncbi:MAG: alanine--tRNA ligase [Verrucomicrobia bacterium]|nr:alanine--tRNA ligase [Verrucomicrobiota bacterium]